MEGTTQTNIATKTSLNVALTTWLVGMGIALAVAGVGVRLFTVQAGLIKVITPNGGEKFAAGKPIDIFFVTSAEIKASFIPPDYYKYVYGYRKGYGYGYYYERVNGPVTKIENKVNVEPAWVNLYLKKDTLIENYTNGYGYSYPTYQFFLGSVYVEPGKKNLFKAMLPANIPTGNDYRILAVIMGKTGDLSDRPFTIINPSVAEKPDLIIESVTSRNLPPSGKDRYAYFDVTIKNIGRGTAVLPAFNINAGKINNHFAVDTRSDTGKIIGRVTLGNDISLAPGASYSWKKLTTMQGVDWSKIKNVSLTVDAYDVVSETNELNNGWTSGYVSTTTKGILTVSNPPTISSVLTVGTLTTFFVNLSASSSDISINSLEILKSGSVKDYITKADLYDSNTGTFLANGKINGDKIVFDFATAGSVAPVIVDGTTKQLNVKMTNKGGYKGVGHSLKVEISSKDKIGATSTQSKQEVDIEGIFPISRFTVD